MSETNFMSIAEVHEHEKMLRDELDEALGKIARLQVDLHQTVVELEEWKEQAAIYKDQKGDEELEVKRLMEVTSRYRAVLKRISVNSLGEGGCKRVAREALADRP